MSHEIFVITFNVWDALTPTGESSKRTGKSTRIRTR